MSIRGFKGRAAQEKAMYAITATISASHGIVAQIPTFYLDESVQGITSEADAMRVARDIIDPLDACARQLGGFAMGALHITAVKVS